jgi:hypothetical protein
MQTPSHDVLPAEQPEEVVVLVTPPSEFPPSLPVQPPASNAVTAQRTSHALSRIHNRFMKNASPVAGQGAHGSLAGHPPRGNIVARRGNFAQVETEVRGTIRCEAT